MQSQLDTGCPDLIISNERAGQVPQVNAPDMLCRTGFLAMAEHGSYKEKTCF